MSGQLKIRSNRVLLSSANGDTHAALDDIIVRGEYVVDTAGVISLRVVKLNKFILPVVVVDVP